MTPSAFANLHLIVLFLFLCEPPWRTHLQYNYFQHSESDKLHSWVNELNETFILWVYSCRVNLEYNLPATHTHTYHCWNITYHLTAHIHWLVTKNVQQVLNVNRCNFSTYFQLKTSYAVSCQMPFCQSNSQLLSITRQ